MRGCCHPGQRHVASARQARRASRQEERLPALGDATLLLAAYTRATAPAGLPTGRNKADSAKLKKAQRLKYAHALILTRIQ